MARVLVTDTYLEDIGDAIRDKLEVETTYKPSEMASAIESIETYPEPTGTKQITANGTGIDVKDFASADVNVPNSYSASDEGKVVSEGELVAQTSTNITANGTVDTTLNDEVVVAVPNTYTSADEGKVVDDGALVAQGSQTITENGTYDTTLISELIANISGGGGGGVDLSEYDVLKGVSWEQGAVSGASGKTWEQNKTSSTTRIRMTETTAIESSHSFYVKINDGYDASVHQYNSSGKYSSISGWGDYDNKSIVISQPNLGITIRKTGDVAITPSEISDVGLAVYDITALIEDGGGGG